jgi:hypothetical protein
MFGLLFAVFAMAVILLCESKRGCVVKTKRPDMPKPVPLPLRPKNTSTNEVKP